MNESPQKETLVPQSNFEQIFQRRINDIQQKVSKYCSQYDALMNLLPIGNQFSSLLNFQRDIEIMDTKIGTLNKKVNSINEYEVPIDRSYWQKQLQNFKQSNSQTKKQIQKIKQTQKEKSLQIEDDYFSQKLQQKVKQYEQMITTKLANYKNQVQKERHKESKQNYKGVYNSINEKIQQYFKPYHKQLDHLLEEIQICRLKVPLRDVKDFHDFNHHRLLQEILYLNQQLEKLFQILNHSEQGLSQIDQHKIEEINNQITSIRYQAIANRKKCLNDILLYDQNYSKSNKNSFEKIEDYFNDSFQQLEQSLLQIQQRLDVLLRYIAQN